MRNGNPNAKTPLEIDHALREASFAAGGDGDTFRRVNKGHQFEFSASRHDCPDPSALAQPLADALGCRVKVGGYSNDGLLVIGHIDADNWNVDEDGVALPFQDGSFDRIPGPEAVPAGYPLDAGALAQAKAEALGAGAVDAPAAAEPGPDDAPEIRSEEDEAILAVLRGAAPAAIKAKGPASGSLSVSDPALAHIDATAEIRLALALRDAGVDLAKLRLALDRLARP